jgi:FAD-linked oxidoreductase
MNDIRENWSGSVKFQPQNYSYPITEEEICALVKLARMSGRKIRMVGAGHSFTPLAQPTDILVSLDKMQGLISADKSSMRATVWAGTRLKALGEILHAEGMAMENLGDIDVQAIAGAMSTGTHGTGTRFGTLATQLRGITFVDGTGELRTLKAESDADLFPALQISLGSCGIITRLEIQTVPAYKLQYVAKKSTLDHVLANLESYKSQNRNFEFYWFPYTQTVQTKESNETSENPTPRGVGKWLNDIVLENGVFSVLSGISKNIPGTSAAMSKLSAAGVSSGKDINWSHRVYATPRLVKFQEMEYNIPQEHFSEAIRRLDAVIRQRKFKVHFPMECRWVAPDNIYLSPAYQRESAYIAVHMYKGMPHQEYFEAMEEILQSYGGRPHWGKMHTMRSNQLKKVYPMWDKFQEIRRQMDPDGVFLNPYLTELFGA